MSRNVALLTEHLLRIPPEVCRDQRFQDMLGSAVERSSSSDLDLSSLATRLETVTNYGVDDVDGLVKVGRNLISEPHGALAQALDLDVEVEVELRNLGIDSPQISL